MLGPYTPPRFVVLFDELRQWRRSRPPRPHALPTKRVMALRLLGSTITAFTLLEAFWLGFAASWAQPLVAVSVAYALELTFESLDARGRDRRPRYGGGGLLGLVDYLLPAHITGLAIAMLLYPGERLLPIVFAVSVAIGAKFALRVAMNGRSRHFHNRSNSDLGRAAGVSDDRADGP